MKRILPFFAFTLSAGLCVGLSFLAVQAESKIIIDEVNKKIIVQSGDAAFSVDTLGSLGTGTLSGADQKTGDIVSFPPTTGAVSTGSVSTGVVTTGSVVSESSLDAKVYLQLTGGTELDKAHYWMYENGLTKYDTLTGYRPADPLLRQEAAKIITQAYQVLGYSEDIKNTECNFSDATAFDPSLSDFITKSCQYQIFLGSKGKFLPNQSLTKAEALTVLVRILEGKTSSEAIDPRWTHYFIKAKELGLTNETNVLAMDRPVTRHEIALLVYRFKNLILDQQAKADALSKLNVINAHPSIYLDTLFVQSGSGEASSVVTGMQDLLSGNLVLDTEASISILNNPELIESVQRMRDKGLTSATTVSNYHPFDLLNREQAAKMFDYFSRSLNFTGIVYSGTRDCAFTDLNPTDEALRSSIKKVCESGIMQGVQAKFSPKDLMTKAQFITILIRTYEGELLSENVSPWWSNYFLKAKELGIINNQDAVSFDQAITRYEAALLFYRSWVKKTITENINTSKLKNELVSTVKNADGSFTKASATGATAIYIDTNLLKNQYFSEGYLELLGKRYQIKKTDVTNFDISSESFVRYGDILDLANGNKIGSLNFIISNGYIVDGTLRFPLEGIVYLISEDPLTTAWYSLTRG